MLHLHLVGGLGAFGRNCLLVEDRASGDAVVVDAGAGFPRESGLGHERLIPDPAFLDGYRGRLKGYLCTHGHEDHIGAIPSFLARLPAPLYASATTLALIRHRLDEYGIAQPPMHELTAPGEVTVGNFQVTALAVGHSIPDSLCLLLRAGGVAVLHSGDFRAEEHPLPGAATDLDGLRTLGDDGVDVLLCDSTGAVSDGRNPGERAVLPALGRAVEEARGRVFVTTFASHVARVEGLLRLAERTGRRLLLAGRGALTHARIAQGLGRLTGLDGVGVNPADAAALPPERLAVVLSGCQGEEYSAFWRLAHGDGRLPPVDEGDVVIHSARAVPGNEHNVAELLDLCARRGARVLDGRDGLHVSGHGHREDLRLLLQAARPRAVVPVHGGHRHLHAMAELARSAGWSDELTPVCDSGDILAVAPHAPPLRVGHVDVPDVLLCDDGTVFPAEPALSERRDLGAGLVVVSASLSSAGGAVLGAPRVSQRGLGGSVREVVLAEAAHEAHVSLNALDAAARMDAESVEAALVRGVRRVLRRARGVLPSVVAHAHVVDARGDAGPPEAVASRVP
ncbi:MAG: ribonuclease J [Deltaproteobacteria bacterium]|nr:ribonuclease J [Deltaproteobacteria bacterium]